MMSKKLIQALRVKWLRLRLLCRPGSVLVDYRILKNYIHICADSRLKPRDLKKQERSA